MEADWEVEIGQEAPAIEAIWSGFIDLRNTPQLATLLPESVEQPGLAEALVSLNQSYSPVWTAKCDAWSVDHPEDFDPDELDTNQDCLKFGQGCYIDLLPANALQWANAEMAAQWGRAICSRLHPLSLDCCRIDLVVRKAWITPQLEEHGITAYFTACAATAASAKLKMETVLRAFADVLLPRSTVE